ncbi:endolytic transglycosylase MltG [Thalassobacillus devorans]|uniref:endolytic transglycosylase MltG n=1 Tax=Thalassobacillus devorans TaxID=279813 RepID=UPI00048BC033|nr:endolytic transglycosylase MltG [Thalassobacillus devorans]
MSDSNFKDLYQKRLKKRGEEASTVRKVVAIVLTTLLVVFIGGGIAGYLYIKAALEPVDPNAEEEITVEIPLGSSTSSIASILEEKNLIKNDVIFRFYTKFKNESDFQAGEYQFTQAMTIDQLIESLKTGKVIREPLFRVTVPEGRKITEIAETFAKSKQTDFTAEAFIKKADNPKYIKKLMEQYPQLLTEEIQSPKIRHPLEGYLFASTYDFYEKNPSIETIIERMLTRTQEIVLPYRPELENLSISTVHELITMASLLENEAPKAEDRKKIAGVFYNRLEKEMPLQTDPTVLYALGKHKDRVLHKDLEVESPYNTYQIKGLPVGPISNFNKNSLEAAVNPPESDYLYFVADSEGNVYYSKNYDEHLKKKKKHIDSQR